MDYMSMEIAVHKVSTQTLMRVCVNRNGPRRSLHTAIKVNRREILQDKCPTAKPKHEDPGAVEAGRAGFG